MWSPYAKKPLIWTLEGHQDGVVGLALNEASNQIISVSADRTIKVWDIRRLLCVQTIADDAIYEPLNKLSTAVFDHKQKRLVCCD